MEIALFDIIGILFFLCTTAFVYQKSWFYSYYSFVKFLIVFIVSFIVGLAAASKVPPFLPLNNLQFSLLAQGLLFITLWKFVSFKKLFFKLDKLVPLNRLFFISGIDRVLNIIPSAIVSFFFTFFIFTLLISISTSYPLLQHFIETSKIVKPISYKVYLAGATLGSGNFKLFEGVAFNTIPSTTFDSTGTANNEVPTGGSTTFTPDNVLPNTQEQTPSANNASALNPTPTPENRRIKLIVLPTNLPTPTITSTPTQQSPRFQNSNPTPTTAPITKVLQPSVNISTVEQDIFRLTNDERAKNGISALVWDDQLAGVARAHSQDMNDRNFFSHINPDGADPYTRMQKAGISYSSAAENIAGAPTADLIVSNWMNSQGHRANILNPAYHKLGVGVASNSQYGILATQTFTN